MSKRIWELDALRGLCILGMVAVHLALDLGRDPGPVQQWGGCLFLVLSGVSVTLGTHPVKRGLTVLGCGLVCTAATTVLWLLELTDRSGLIYFGVLHCLGLCMLLWPMFSRLPRRLLPAAALGLMALGLWMEEVRVDFPWLIPLGLQTPDFASADYFPLTVNLGYFLLGASLGRLLYPHKCSRLPKVPAPRFLCFCGRHSLWIYLAHQPILLALLALHSAWC